MNNRGVKPTDYKTNKRATLKGLNQFLQFKFLEP